MRRSESIRKIGFKEIVPPVFGDIKKKPKLLIPFVISFVIIFFINLINAIVSSQFAPGIFGYQNDLGIGILDDYFSFMWLSYLWSLIVFIIVIMTTIIFSAWSIINYWTYIRTGDFSLKRTFKKTFRYFWKMVGASMLAALILYIPIHLPQIIIFKLVISDLGSDFILRWPYEISMVWKLWTLALTSIFVFIHHAIIIEKEGVIGSLKRSFRVLTKNYLLVFFLLITPLLLAIPFMVLGQLLYSTEEPMFTVSNLIRAVIPYFLAIILGPIVTLSIIRTFILSVFRSRRTRDKWGFKT